MKGHMFDTNIFNALVDLKIDITLLPIVDYYVTHLQYDEINGTKDLKRRASLQNVCDRLKMTRVLTESAVYGVSRYDNAKLSDGKLFEQMRDRLRSLDNKPNNEKALINQSIDILIVETCIKNDWILVTEDRNLMSVSTEFNGKAVSLKEFLKNTS